MNASMVVYLRRSFGRNTINVVEAFAMPCDRSSAGPSIMIGKQPLNVIMVADVEASSGSHAM